MNSHLIQREELAGKTKLTSVVIHTSPSRRGKHCFFVMLPHDQHGNAVIPMSTYDELLKKAHMNTGFIAISQGVTLQVDAN